MAKQVTNAELINALLGSEYSDRIPVATQNNLTDVAEKILASG